MKALETVYLVLLILGGILALSGLIVMKTPQAKRYIDKLVPFQALIGIALMVLAFVLLVRLGPINLVRALNKSNVLAPVAWIAAIVSGILIGFCFGISQIASWSSGPPPGQWPPGQAPGQWHQGQAPGQWPGQPPGQPMGSNAMGVAEKLAPYTMLLGIVMLGSAGLILLNKFGLLKYF